MYREFKLLTVGTMLLAVSLHSNASTDNVANPAPSAVALYRQLSSLRLDPNRIFRVRDLSIETHEIHLTFNDGLIAFTEPVDGVITGAYFQGEGEVLVFPPDRVERESLALFTGNAVLEEKFTAAFFRFQGGEMGTLADQLKVPVAATEFFERANGVVQSLGASDALALLNGLLNRASNKDATFLHARVQGLHLGNFDVVFDPVQSEQISIGRSNSEGARFYDVWTRFASRSAGAATDPVEISEYRIKAQFFPPSELAGEVTLNVKPLVPGIRCVIFELSRNLKIKAVSRGKGQPDFLAPSGRTSNQSLPPEPVEFIQNESLEGTELARRGNDVAAVILPEALPLNANTELNFMYEGPVLSDAGNGLIYVGARGTWYPNRGPAMAKFDMFLTYPKPWSLGASGEHISDTTALDKVMSHWKSERPVPVAGFNLGKYQKIVAKSGTIDVAVFAAKGIENLEAPEAPGAVGKKAQRRRGALAPDPVRNMDKVAKDAAGIIESLQKRLGPFPFSSLAITQMPGPISQGWPGLIFLSSYAFLPEEDRISARGSYEQLLYSRLMLAHETAHQWWGDRVMWAGPRDAWLVEALANYSALQTLEEKRPEDMRTALDYYLASLVRTNAKGKTLSDAGPVTLGFRLSSTKFPTGYEEVAYGRGTWLVHMLREMLRDQRSKDPDAHFNVGMRELIEKLDGKQMSNRDVQSVFEKYLPADLRYEDKRSLDWFFDGWVNGSAVPTFSLEAVHYVSRKGGVSFTGTIVESDAPENLVSSLPIYGESRDPEMAPLYLGRVFADERETTFTIAAPTGTRKLLLDPYRTVLRK